jgi:hypothetical protein
MSLRAQYQGLLVSYQDITLGQLEQWIKNNPQADVKQVKKIKKRIQLAKDEEQE